jgi:hypothetical protein
LNNWPDHGRHLKKFLNVSQEKKGGTIMEESEKSSLLGRAMHVGERLAEVGGEARD